MTVEVNENPPDVFSPENDDEDKRVRNKDVEKITVYAVTEPIEKKADVEREIIEKFNEIGVDVKSMRTKSNYKGMFEGSLLEISPINLNRIWGRRLGLNNCAVIERNG